MKNLRDKFLGGLVGGLGFICIIGLTGVAYGAYVSLTNVTTGQTLTSNLFNEVLENIRTLKIGVDNSSHSGAVMAFNLSTCPTGRIPANGTNGTPDLRGEFIRGLDDGRGVDSGRTLASGQLATRVYRNNSTTYGYLGSLYDQDQFISVNYDGAVESITGTNGYYAGSAVAATTWAVSGVRVRPRNVALLYCVKQ